VNIEKVNGEIEKILLGWLFRLKSEYRMVMGEIEMVVEFEVNIKFKVNIIMFILVYN
jgi:hypothetical protein